MSALVSRRACLFGAGSVPLLALPLGASGLIGCGTPRAETPLAHLYGERWVHGAYQLYSERYEGVQTLAETNSTAAYGLLAQRGITSLDALQSREVPFFVRVDQAGDAFALERDLPERLTFTADMSAEQRARAQEVWQAAREHVHHDYDDIRRLNWALTELLGSTQRVRNAIDEGEIEQFRLVLQLLKLEQNPESLPFELPYQVGVKDYQEIVLLLLERLEHDREALRRLEANILVVGLTARSTDANSATLAASLRKVLLAVVEDGQLVRRPLEFPSADERAAHLKAARALQAKIAASEAFKAWERAERERALLAIGSFLEGLELLTQLPLSSAYKTILSIWRGEADYLAYLRTAMSFIPSGSAVGQALGQAIELTNKVRKATSTVVGAVQTAQRLGKSVQRGDLEALLREASERASGAVINTGSRFALDRIGRQLSFFTEQAEVSAVTELLQQTPLMKVALPSLKP